MNRLFIIVAVALLAAAAQPSAQQTSALDKLFASARHKATVTADLKGAIEDYKRIVSTAGKNRAAAAQALLLMAEAYQNLGDDGESQKIYQRVVREFSEPKELVAIARTRILSTRDLSAERTLKDVEGLNPSGYLINVSADGRYATHVNTETGNIAIRDLQSAKSKEITRRRDFVVQDPVISRDGKFVAYQSFNGCIEGQPTLRGNGDLCVLASEGEPLATPRTVFARADIKEVTPMDWSPDGRSLATVLRLKDGSTRVGVVRIADGMMNFLQSTDWRGATRVFFSPDGRYLAFDVTIDAASDDLSIQIVSADGSRGALVVRHPSQNVVMGWTPDGKHLLFASDRGGSTGLWAQRVTEAKAEGPPRMIHAGLGGALSLGVTTAGDLYFEVQSGSRDVEIANIYLADGRKSSVPSLRPLSRYVGSNGMPEWSRDGKFLAYVSRRGFSRNTDIVIGILESATGSIRELRPKLVSSTGIAWAPDGSELMVAGTDLNGRSGIFSIDTRSGETRLVSGGYFAAYAADGRHIYYVTASMEAPQNPTGSGLPVRSIVERNIASGTERVIATGHFLRASLSPDGRLFAAARGGSGAAAAEVVTIAVDTGNVRQLYEAKPGDNIPTGVNLAWTPDGQAVLMRKRPPLNELWLVPTTGMPPRKIDADVNGWAFGIAGSISLHPDGRQLAVTRIRQSPGAAVRVLQNVVASVK